MLPCKHVYRQPSHRFAFGPAGWPDTSRPLRSSLPLRSPSAHRPLACFVQSPHRQSAQRVHTRTIRNRARCLSTPASGVAQSLYKNRRRRWHDLSIKFASNSTRLFPRGCAPDVRGFATELRAALSNSLGEPLTPFEYFGLSIGHARCSSPIKRDENKKPPRSSSLQLYSCVARTTEIRFSS
jgi:hypothetical protein